MTVIRIDPSAPGVDIELYHCPDCDQTLAVILDGGASLPHGHYRRPTFLWGGPRQGQTAIRIDGSGWGNGQGCTIGGDDLARLVPEYVSLPRGVAAESGEVAWSRDPR